MYHDVSLSEEVHQKKKEVHQKKKKNHQRSGRHLTTTKMFLFSLLLRFVLISVVDSLVVSSRPPKKVSSYYYTTSSRYSSSDGRARTLRTSSSSNNNNNNGIENDKEGRTRNTTTPKRITLQTTSSTKQQEQQHDSVLFGRKQNHPTSYEDHPSFKGPLVLPSSNSTSDARERIRRYYYKNRSEEQQELPVPIIKSLSPNSSTSTILKRIVEQLAYVDAPLDAKEVAESMEFYLRTYKRLLGSCRRQNTNNIITVYDMCAGHGFTGMLYAACNPPRNNNKKGNSINIVLVDQTEPPSHQILKDCIAEICPWIAVVDDDNEKNNTDEKNKIQFVTATLEEFAAAASSPKSSSSSNNIVLSTHACGSLTDSVIEYCITTNTQAVALMPCCYTGTDSGVPYGIRRALGVSMSADVRRSFVLQNAGYHVDFATIPSEITPMNRIIVAERK